MNYISPTELNKANKEAVLNVYSYLADNVNVKDGADLNSIVATLEKKSGSFDEEKLYQFNVLKNAVSEDKSLGSLRIDNQVKTGSGLNACTFTDKNGKVSVVFRGTGDGEWIDNGEALTGKPQSNTYNTYDSNGNLIKTETVANDYASDQQVDALNWFNKTAAKNGWDESTNIVVSGHSKGGNKAQFITMKSEIVDKCYSFDGQGFSPEAIQQLKNELGPDFENHRQKISGFAADNDYVNVLGSRLISDDKIYFFDSPIGDKNIKGYHYMEAMLDENGRFNNQVDQGGVSSFIEDASDELMRLPPSVRQNATLGVMNICHFILGEGEPVNDDSVSVYTTALGTVIMLNAVEREGIDKLFETSFKSWNDKFNRIEQEEGLFAKANAMITGFSELAITAPFLISLYTNAKMREGILSAISFFDDGIRHCSEKIYASIQGFFKSVHNNVNVFFDRRYSSGKANIYYDSVIKADVGSLYNFCSRVREVSCRIEAVQCRLQAVYDVEGLNDLYKILDSDFFDSYKRYLENNSKYLMMTAAELDSAENAVNNLF